MQGGNLAGLTLFIGSPGLHDLRYVFPACSVASGEFIILHLKPQGLPEELDELDDVTLSGGLDASAVARDFWVRGEPGALSGKNGVVTLSVSPNRCNHGCCSLQRTYQRIGHQIQMASVLPPSGTG
jgi:hypothetical protein